MNTPSNFHKQSVHPGANTALNNPYCLATADTDRLVLIEPTVKPAPVNFHLESITRRYCKITGFDPRAIKIDCQGTFYTARINLAELGPIRGTGQLVGKGGVISGKPLITDTFNLHQMENSEYVNQR